MTNTPTSSSGSQGLLQIVEDALDVPTVDRDEWLEINCPEPLISKARRMISSADEATGDSEAEITLLVQAAEQQLAGQRIGAYRVIELIGEGGMGQVYLAERADGAFDATVALKVIRASAIGSRAVAQFERERQILSDLRHPNIANLLDGGTTSDGMPFVVMEYIDGLPLDAFARESDLDLRSRLQLFLKICAAVEHAHRALVIHRDIKPSNVLVTTDGEPKLLDFGIARSLRPRDDGEDTVAMLLTPAYASPEQVTGEPLTTATDVYSLGVVLYQLLTGERPFATDSLSPAAYEQVITQKRPDAPSQRAKERSVADWGALRGELDAIVLKAMAKEPERRYGSVSALADDLSRYLNGFPVQARGDSVGYRLRKFVQRHRYAVAAGVLTSLALIGAYGVTLVQYQIATEERARADARFEQARELANEVFYGVYDQMSFVQGTLPARQALAETGVVYLDELAKDERAPNDILLDVGTHYTRLYDIYAGLGVASIGDVDTGFAQIVKADELLTELHERQPERADIADQLVWTKRLLTNHHLAYGMDTTAAEAAARDGLAVADRVIASQSEPDWRLHSRRWNLRIDLVKVLNWTDRNADAVALLDGYLTAFDDPEFVANVRNPDGKLAYARSMRGEMSFDMGRTQDGVPDLAAARDYYETMIEAQPDNHQMLIQGLRTNSLLARSYTRLEDWPQAVAFAERGRELGEALVAMEPTDAGARRNLASQNQALAFALLGAGNAGRAESVIESCITTYRELASADPSNESLMRDHASALRDAGEIYAVTKSSDTACGYFRHAESLWNALAKRGELTDYDRRTSVEPLATRIAQSCP